MNFSPAQQFFSTAVPGPMVHPVPASGLCCVTQADQNAESFLNDWPDGTPKSFGNGFTEHMDGQPSRFALDRVFFPSKATGQSASHTSSQSRKRVEATGRNIGTIVGLSKKSEQTQQDARRYHVTKGE